LGKPRGREVEGILDNSRRIPMGYTSEKHPSLVYSYPQLRGELLFIFRTIILRLGGTSFPII
jgi:hypothetical protein